MTTAAIVSPSSSPALFSPASAASSARANSGWSGGGSSLPSASSSLPQPALVVPLINGAEAPLPAAAQIPSDHATPEEQHAIATAEDIFFEGVAQSPTNDPNSDEYASYWETARSMSDDHLRAVLGWSRFNALTGDAAKAEYQQLVQQNSAASLP